MAQTSQKLPEVSRCRSCKAEIYWMKTAKGNLNPVDASSVNLENWEGGYFNPKVHLSHFATCRDARAWRAKGNK